MGVDYSTTIGYGFKVDKSRLSPAILNSEDFEEYGLGEFLDNIFWRKDSPWPLLSYSTLGSYYDSGDEAVQHFIVVKRITRSYDAYDIPGGEFVVNNSEPTAAEYEQLSHFHGYLYDTYEGFAPRSFAGGLWH